MAGRPRVVTIPSGVAFVDALAAGVLAELGPDPLVLAQATILLPTRRACRALREAFLRASGGKALLLPRLRPIGDVDEDELIDGDSLDGGEDVPPAIDPVERHCLLTRLVLQREGGDPALAARLAAALAQLLDSLETEEIAFAALAGIVPDRFAAHWQQTLAFLSIVGEAWPQILAERGLIDPAARRVRLIRALARRWGAHPPAYPVYAAGSTGSIPASAALIGVVARLPRGTVVLPGLDRVLDDDAWAKAGEDATHPQFGLHQLLTRMEITREEVADWVGDWSGASQPATLGDASGVGARVRLLAAAMVPAARTADWQDLEFPDAAFAGLARIEAPSAQEEALAIALALRRALETPGRTAALVTPDRGLARRVAAELSRWTIAIDDSAGRPLARTPQGVFFLLVARMVAEDFAPLPLLAALKHPLVSLGLPRGAWLSQVRRLERRALRGPRPAPGLAGLRAAVVDAEANDLLDWLDAFATAASPLAALMAGPTAEDVSAGALMAAHVGFAEALATRNGVKHLWAGAEGEALAAFVAALVAASDALGPLSGHAWPDLVESLMGSATVRPRWGSHPRLAIWGPLEARLLNADLVILGGLNEGGWPAEPTEDPWLSRPMRRQVGLPAPERRIGLSAHDFAQAAAAPEVLLTRARKVEGAPTVKSRWWLRLDAMLTRDAATREPGAEPRYDPRWEATRDRDLITWAEALDAPGEALAPPEPPKPRPPVAARPRRLSVTQVETWVRDPYAVYARHVLKLRRLDPLDADIGAIERGVAIHQALDAFVSAHPGPLPEDAAARLIAEGEQRLQALLAQPAWRAFWWPRFVAAARWFVDFERQHRTGGVRTVATELKGELTLAGTAGPFLLTATADRIDRSSGPGGGLWIIDYKTGKAPTAEQVASGLAPQLPLEGAIALAGGFPGVPPDRVQALAFIELRGGSPPGELKTVDAERDGVRLDAMTLAQEARDNLERFIRRFDDATTPYLSRPRPQFLRFEGDYDHLARVREWQGGAVMTTDEDLQRRATAPDASVWVSANAGSGKTHVLASRVTRLLLAGTRPSAMLCLTFTKAAAAEMSNRVYRDLATWTVLDDAALATALYERGERDIDTGLLGRARALFAQTLDAPGGLKIQTIHAFCELLLKRFPLEAGVPPHFAVADEAAAAELLAEARDRLVREAMHDTALRDALALVAAAASEGSFNALMAEAVERRRRLQVLAMHFPAAAAASAAMCAALGVAPGDSDETLVRDFLTAAPRAALRRAAAALKRGSAKDIERSLLVAQLAEAAEGEAIDLLWKPAFLTTAGEPRVGLGTRVVDAAAIATLRAEQERLIAFRARYDAARLARASCAFLALGQRLLALYARAKAERAVLDYDDLILRARDLLAAPDAAPWVLYKLDGGLDHILVDEAQDTAAEQWAVIAALAAEFFAGSGGREVTRTVFAVGDPKQSIFGFQGAEPALFEAQRDSFRRQVRQAGQRWEDTPLQTSRRSVPAILGFVDALFARDAARPGVLASDDVLRHATVRTGVAGFVELWPVIQAEEDEAATPWDAPLDYVGERSPSAILAARIADMIAGWIARREILEGEGRPIGPGDVLILVRRRDAFFQAIVRALKKQRTPVAGVDRLVLAEEIAVMDLVALGRFALLPQDDLTLATVLKGPLFGFSEEALFDLAHGRTARLWGTLQDRADERPEWREAAHALRTILARVDTVGPYDFFAGILSARGGRARILARLGPEAAEPLDEFLAQALAFERMQPPALENFLHWFAAAGAEIKRDPEPARAEVRVMTVHGAKGLQANIVILPDTCGLPNAGGIEPLVAWSEGSLPSGGLPLWPGAGGRDHPMARDARQALRAAEADEHRRLLYVAATRARDRLYVCGWFNKRKPTGCWYDLVADTFDDLPGTTDVALPWGERGRRFAMGAAAAAQAARETGPTAAAALPGWARAPAPVERLPPRPLAPSRPASEPPVSSPLTDAQRFRRGRLIHRLLQALPEVAADRRAAVAARMLAGEALAEDARDEIVAAALGVLRDPAVAAAFGPGSLAEAPVVGRVGSQVIAGQVDRLVVGADVLVIDYKTNRPPPRRAEDVASAYLEQMAAYRALLREIYPGRPVRCALLWTEGPRLMPLADRLLDRHVPKPLI